MINDRRVKMSKIGETMGIINEGYKIFKNFFGYEKACVKWLSQLLIIAIEHIRVNVWQS